MLIFCLFCYLFLAMAEVWDICGKVSAVAKREIMYCGPFGIAAYLVGLIFIDRMNSEESKSALKEAGRKIREEKVCDFAHFWFLIKLGTI